MRAAATDERRPQRPAVRAPADRRDRGTAVHDARRRRVPRAYAMSPPGQEASPDTQAGPLVATYLEAWLRRQALRVKESTLDLYRRDVALHFAPALGGRRLGDVRPVDIDALLTRLLQSGRSPTTVRRLHREILSAFETATELGLMTENPARAVRPPARSRREMRVLSVDEARRLLAAAAGTPMHPLLYTALETGARRGELLALRWADVDLPGRELRVRRTIREFSGRGIVEMEPKTHRSRRAVALSAEAVGVLRRHRVEQGVRRLRLGARWREHDLVFPSGIGTHWRPSNMRRAFQALALGAGIEGVTFHTLRHTCASLMAMQGVPITSISAQLGHASSAITYAIYAHVLPGMQHEAASRVASALR